MHTCIDRVAVLAVLLHWQAQADLTSDTDGLPKAGRGRRMQRRNAELIKAELIKAHMTPAILSIAPGSHSKCQ
jgi:hypothetical protein